MTQPLSYWRKKKLGMLIGMLITFSPTPTVAQTGSTPLKETKEQFAKRTQWWRDAKFGMFIHWGLYAVPADSHNGMAEWYMSNNRVQVWNYG